MGWTHSGDAASRGSDGLSTSAPVASGEPVTAHFGHSPLPQLRVWVALSAGYAAVVIVLVALVAPSVVMAPWDVFILLDGGWRISMNQVPNLDFRTPLGPLTYALVAWGMTAAGSLSLAAVSWATAFVSAISAAWSSLVAYPRMRPVYAFTFVTLMTTLPVATRPLGYSPDITSYAMLYNRLGWIVLAIIAVQVLLPPFRGGTALRRFDVLSLGLLLALAFFIKITYFMAAIGIVVVAILLRKIDVRILAASAGIAVVLAVLLHAAGFVYLPGYISDVMAAGRIQPIDQRVDKVVSRAVVVPLVLTVASAVVLLWPPNRLTVGRHISRHAAALISFAIVVIMTLFVTSGNAGERWDLPLLAVAGLILVQLRRGRIPGGIGRAEALAIALLIPVIAVPLGSDLASLARSADLSRQVSERELDYVAFESERLEDFIIPASSDWRTAFWVASDVPDKINDGLELLRRNATEDDRVMALALTDPFSFALDLKPADGTMLWWDSGFSYEVSSPPDASSIFENVTLVMVPQLGPDDEGCCHYIASDLTTMYGSFLEEHYSEVDSSDEWQLLRRDPGVS